MTLYSTSTLLITLVFFGAIASLCLFDMEFTADPKPQSGLDFKTIFHHAARGHVYAVMYLLCLAAMASSFLVSAFLRFSVLF